MRVAVVGFGTAGQAAALFLARAGHAVEVFEQAPEPGPVGAGFLLQPTGLAVLAQLGLAEGALAYGARIERLHGVNSSGRTVMDMRYGDHAAGAFGLGMTRGALHTLLAQAWMRLGSVRTGCRIVAADAQRGVLRTAAGEDFGGYDLIVAADGCNSALRAQCAIPRRDPLYPWGAVWALLPARDWDGGTELRQRYHGCRYMIGILPVGKRPDLDGEWLTFYYSVRGDHVEAFNGDSLQQLRAHVQRAWPALLPLLDTLPDAAALQRARYRDVVLRHPYCDRLVFIGDSAHSMSPQLGQGANMALLDAMALAQAVASHSAAAGALPAYARARRSHVAVYQALSRWLTPLFQSDADWLGWVRDLAFGPLGRLPGLRGEMLRVLTGSKRGWFS